MAVDVDRDARRALAAGVPPWHIVVDPGIGFAKTPDHSLTLLRDLGAFVAHFCAAAPPQTAVSHSNFDLRSGRSADPPLENLTVSLENRSRVAAAAFF